MNIRYLKKIKEKLPVADRELQGASEAEIKAVEAKFHIKFPEAYKEYLFLAGKKAGGLLLDSSTLDVVSADWFHDVMRNEIKERSITIAKPYWIFSHEDEFYFFYLGNGIEDPLVYYTRARSSGDPSLVHDIVAHNKPFSEFINNLIDYSINAHKTGAF